MTVLVEKLLHSFDDLSNTERREFASEILQRTIDFDFPPLQDDKFIDAAEDLFLAFDYEKEANGVSQTR